MMTRTITETENEKSMTPKNNERKEYIVFSTD
jgi:hypothetical protein